MIVTFFLNVFSLILFFSFTTESQLDSLIPMSSTDGKESLFLTQLMTSTLVLIAIGFL